ncbi:MAG: SpoIIE family protein phosphatase [Gemmatimonadetes bacterium]|nr:SpoIIE family protein phosphatase [Gemmatimonadota bacterium]
MRYAAAPALRGLHSRPQALLKEYEMPFWLTGEHRGQTVRVELETGVCSVGRSAANDLSLPSQTVSRSHAQVVLEGDSVFVVDLSSLNGTRVNGENVDAGGRREVSSGDMIEFGSVMLRLTDREESSVPTWTEDNNISESIHLSREESAKSAIELAGQDARFLGLVIEAGGLMVDPGDPQETFDRIVELVDRTIQGNRILILEREGNGPPVQRAARVKGARALSPLMLSRTMVNMVLDQGASLLTGDAQADDRFKNQQSIMGQDLRSAMAVPLVHADQIMGVLYVDSDDPMTTYTERDLRVLTLLGQMLGAKIANALLVETQREKERLERELQTASAIQRRILRTELPQPPGYDFSGRQDTCEDVGGDLYDAAAIPGDRFQIVLGDVSGKGIGAALLMTDVLGAIRVLREEAIEPARLIRRLDHHLLQTTQPEHYVTMFLAELDPVNHRLDYVNAGHPPAYLIHADGRLEHLASTGMPVGLMDMDLPTKFESASVDFPPGAALVIYSDGVSEAQADDVQFDEGSFEPCLQALAGKSSGDIIDGILAGMQKFVGDTPQPDDITLLTVRRSS